MHFPTEDNSATLHALFPTLIYQANLNDHASFKNLFAAVIEKYDFNSLLEDGGKHNAGEYHGKILLHQEKSLSPFFVVLADQVKNYLSNLGLRTEFFEIQCLKSWFVLCDPDEDEEADAVETHNHSCSDISWVYYVDIPDDCPAINFHAGQRLNTAFFESTFHNDRRNSEKSSIFENNWWNSDAWSIKPDEGDIVMFPGHQLHSVDANLTKTRRVSIAGDISLVLKEEFIDLEFGRTASKHWLTLPLQ